LLAVKSDKIDRIDQQRRVAALTGDFRDNPPGERKKQTGTFDQEQRLHILLPGVLQLKHASIKELYDEHDGVLTFGVRRQSELYPENIVLERTRLYANVDSQLDLGSALPGLAIEEAGILEGEVLGVLSQNPDHGRLNFAICRSRAGIVGGGRLAHVRFQYICTVQEDRRLSRSRDRSNQRLTWCLLCLYRVWKVVARHSAGHARIRALNIELIILAAVAVFVISRLYAVLGQKTGAEPPARRFREAVARTAEVEDDADGAAGPARLRPAFTGPAAAGMETIASIDRAFSPDEFTKGARRAYELIVAAFADGDRDALQRLVDDDVFEAYDAAITQREASGAEPMRVVRVKTARIIEAALVADDLARVSVSFEGELSDGENSRTAKEIWTFKRLLRSDDPNWLLDEVATAS